jgi:hypothetical protein
MKRLALVVLAVLPASALAAPPQTPPRLCAGDAFGDLVGTRGDDQLQAPPRATRVWGLEGADGLIGSTSRAACLLGGPGRDLLALNRGGGLAYGNQGRDTITGSDLGDVIEAGYDTDGVAAGAGDDRIGARDGSAEVVDCGPGLDTVKADRRDVLIACESVDVTGPSALRLSPSPSETSSRGLVRVRMTVPRGAGEGAYRMLAVTDCGRGVSEVARFPAPGARVQRGQHVKIGLHHPDGGWCRGRTRVAVVRSPGQDLPLVGVARLSFTAR